MLIVDKLGCLPFDAQAAHPFFQLVSPRYGPDSLLITSNPSVGQWAEVFGDAIYRAPTDTEAPSAQLSGKFVPPSRAPAQLAEPRSTIPTQIPPTHHPLRVLNDPSNHLGEQHWHFRLAPSTLTG